MSPLEEMHQAQINRSIRTIKAELEYLCDASIISPDTLSDLLSRVPAQTALHAPISVGAVPPATQNNAAALPIQAANGYNNRSEKQQPWNEKQDYPAPSASPQPPPPAYQNAPPPPQAQWPPLAQATALYAYTSTDEGDLELQPGDHVSVTEYMNAEWWKGRSSRTGQEGIFPRSYVKVVEEKGGASASTANGTNYGNMPLETSGMGNGEGKVPGKAEQQGKKFGKKLGMLMPLQLRVGCEGLLGAMANYILQAMRPFSVQARRSVETLSTPSSSLHSRQHAFLGNASGWWGCMAFGRSSN